jgi:hypothetical protein
MNSNTIFKKSYFKSFLPKHTLNLKSFQLYFIINYLLKINFKLNLKKKPM